MIIVKQWYIINDITSDTITNTWYCHSTTVVLSYILAKIFCMLVEILIVGDNKCKKINK